MSDMSTQQWHAADYASHARFVSDLGQPVFDLLKSLGYRGSFFENGRRRPLAEFDPDVHQRIDADSDRLPRGYVNNFAFE